MMTGPIEERCLDALRYWQLYDIDLDHKMASLSGGQKTKVFLAGIMIHQPELILLDEPSNHLDSEARHKLYDFIRSAPVTLIVVSHDRKLLDLMNTTIELDKRGFTTYGGDYQFYTEQKKIETGSLLKNIHDNEKSIKAG